MEILNFFTQQWISNWPGIKFMFVAYGIGLAIETLRPAETNQPSANIRFNFIHGFFFVLFNSIALSVVSKVGGPIREFFGGPYIQLQFNDGLLGELAYTVCFILVFDFFYYWLHRLQHKSPWLWAQHKMHHSEESLNITTHSRFHWLESSFWLFFISIPMGVLFELSSGTLGLIWSVYMLWGFFIHMNLKLSFGWLTGVVAGPQYHRIHHSNLNQHKDKNFSATLPLYDWIFGSYYRPEKNEYPTTGLFDGENMNHLMIAWFSPFKDWSQQLQGLVKKKSTEVDTKTSDD